MGGMCTVEWPGGVCTGEWSGGVCVYWRVVGRCVCVL